MIKWRLYVPAFLSKNKFNINIDHNTFMDIDI